MSICLSMHETVPNVTSCTNGRSHFRQIIESFSGFLWLLEKFATHDHCGDGTLYCFHSIALGLGFL